MSNFISIRTATIRGNQSLFFNLYLKIRDREVLYIKENDPIEEERLSRLKGNKVKKVFIEADAEPNYLKYLEHNLNRLDDPNVSLDEKSDIIDGQAKCAVEDVFQNPESKDTYDYSKKVVDKYVDFMMNNPEAMGHIVNLKEQDFDSYQHAMNVSSLAVGLAMQDKVGDKKELEHLGMGAMLHDIGKTKLNIDEGKSIDDYSEEEMEELRKHPQAGHDMLSGGGFVDPYVLRLILQHEEHANGSGYPNGIKGSEVDKLTPYLSLANIYDRYVTFYKLDPQEAMKKITIDKVGLYDLAQITNLKKLLKTQGVI